MGEEVDGGGRHMQWWQVASRPQQTRGAEHETREPLTSVDRCVKQSATPVPNGCGGGALVLTRWFPRTAGPIPSARTSAEAMASTYAVDIIVKERPGIVVYLGKGGHALHLQLDAVLAVKADEGGCRDPSREGW